MGKPRSSSRRAADDGTVTLILAHPLTQEQATRLGATDVPEEGILQGEEITVPRWRAMSIINSGYAAVDPEDREQVTALVGTPGVEPEATQGQQPG